MIGFYFYRLATAGGAERMICQLAGALADRGLQTMLVSLDDMDASAYYEIKPEVPWHRLGFRPGLLDKVRRTLALARVFRSSGTKVLVGFVMSGDKTVYVAAKLAGVRLVAAERNAPSMYRYRQTPVQRWLSFLLMRLVDRIVVQFEDYAKEYPSPLRGRIRTIPNPVETATRMADPDKPGADGRFTLLSVGRLDEFQKRVACLIEAFAKIAEKHPSWDLEIVGDGPDKEVLAKTVADCRLTNRVRIVPSTPRVAERYAGSSLFAISSLWEGFPNALAEAMAHGLPAVGFAGADGVSHLIEDGRTGWLAAGTEDPDTFSQTLDLAMTDAAERKRRGAQAVRAMASYEPDKQYAKWRRLIEDVPQEGVRTARS